MPNHITTRLTVASTATESEADTIANVLIGLERYMTLLVRVIMGSQFRAAMESIEWRTNKALRDLDCALNSGVEDFLLGPELDEALLSLDGKANSLEYRHWLASYHSAEEQLDAEYSSDAEILR
jgi:hypothetical protein